jgi:chromosome segregation ATPase
MEVVVFSIVALVEVGVAIGLMHVLLSKQKGAVLNLVAGVAEQAAQREALLEKVKSVSAEMIPLSDLKAKVHELRIAKESLKTERGRITITQAERETVEGRLRELEEIERELEASGVETKEELNILQKKQKELSGKNDALKAQINSSVSQMDEILSKIELSAQQTEQVQNMKAQIIQTEQKIDTLLQQIEQGNDQYFILKKRYDALDIEYAQLFEKFSEAGG